MSARSNTTATEADLVLVTQETLDDVTKSVDSRRDGSVGYAVKVAGQFSRLGKVTDELSRICDDHLPSGRWLVLETRQTRRLASAAKELQPFFVDFVREHRALMDDDATERLERFFVWMPKRYAALKAELRRQHNDYDRDLGSDTKTTDDVTDQYDVTLRDRFEKSP